MAVAHEGQEANLCMDSFCTFLLCMSFKCSFTIGKYCGSLVDPTALSVMIILTCKQTGKSVINHNDLCDGHNDTASSSRLTVRNCRQTSTLSSDISHLDPYLVDHQPYQIR